MLMVMLQFTPPPPPTVDFEEFADAAAHRAAVRLGTLLSNPSFGALHCYAAAAAVHPGATTNGRL
jgi:hypothetical protein